jgi:hypothetical protein
VKTRNCLVAFGAAGLLATAGVAGAGVAGSPETSHKLSKPKISGVLGWSITSDTATSSIAYDDDANPWSMNLGGKKNNMPKVKEGKTFYFQQVIDPDSGESWTGWETTLLNPGWEWVVGSTKYADPSLTPVDLEDDGIESLGQHIDVGTSAVGGTLTFTFDGEAGQQAMLLRGFIRYVGTDPTKRNEKFTGPRVNVQSQPMTQIPAPAAGVFFAVAGVAGAIRRRREAVVSGVNGLD